MKKLNNKGMSTLEILSIIVIASIILVAGLAIVLVTTKNEKITTFKEETNLIIKAAKNAYSTYNLQESSPYVVSSTDGTTKGMCITIQGILANGYFTDKNIKWDDWDGYVVIEEQGGEYKYTIWATNKEFVIEGYESQKIDELTTKNDGITAYNNNEFSNKVKTSFTGTTSDKGGTATNSVKRYEAVCINEKIE